MVSDKGLIWCQVGVSLDQFGISLGSVWDQCEVSVVSVWCLFEINLIAIWDPSGHPGAMGQMIPTDFGYGCSQFGIP